MKKRKIIIFGDSHTAALKKALQQFQNDTFDIDIHWLYSNKNGKERGNMPLDEILKKIITLDENDILVISLLGTWHNVFGLLKHSQNYFVFDGKSDEKYDGTELIPYQIIKSYFEDRCSKNSNMNKLKNTSAKVIHLMTPPPKEDTMFIASKLKSMEGKLFQGVGINDSQIRQKLYEIEKLSLKSYCEKIGITFLDAPSESMDHNGFLLEDYWAGDAQHANEKYGMKVLEQIIQTYEKV